MRICVSFSRKFIRFLSRRGILIILVFSCLNNIYCQNAACYRQGYLVTYSNDTIRGFLYPWNEYEVRFTNDHKNVVVYHSGDSVKSFFWQRMEFINANVTDSPDKIFIVKRVGGIIDLYATIQCKLCTKSLLKEIQTSGPVQNLPKDMEGFGTGRYKGPNIFTGTSYLQPCITITNYFIDKNSGTTVSFVPPGRKQFRDFFIPLIQDNIAFLESIDRKDLDYRHLHSLVELYNHTINQNR
jgi:hypothetical protein